jgi:transcriptional regulator with XRE-family HTH domain
MNTNEIRQLNLKRLIGNKVPSSKVADFAKEYDIDASYLSQLLNGHRRIGEKSARNIENKVGIPSGELDNPFAYNDSEQRANSIISEARAEYIASKDGPAAVELLKHFREASPEMKAAALRLLGIDDHLYK